MRCPKLMQVSQKLYKLMDDAGMLGQEKGTMRFVMSTQDVVASVRSTPAQTHQVRNQSGGRPHTYYYL